MSVTYQSVQSSGWVTGNPVVTKPTSLAVGDLMIAIWALSDDNNSISSPAGWTSITSLFNSTNNGQTFYSAYKIADSSDVAATNFTFTYSGGGGGNRFAAIMRFTGTNTSNPIGGSSSGNNNDTTTPSISGFTPTTPNQVFILAITGSNSGTGTFSGYAMATDNPTWTEIIDANTSNLNDSNIAIAYSSVRSQSTATGNFSLTGTEASLNQTLIAFGIKPTPAALTATISETVTLTESVATNVGRFATINETITLTESASAKPSFSNNQKSSSTWTNQEKS